MDPVDVVALMHSLLIIWIGLKQLQDVLIIIEDVYHFLFEDNEEVIDFERTWEHSIFMVMVWSSTKRLKNVYFSMGKHKSIDFKDHC